MTPEEVYQFYGGVIKAAEAVNVSRQTFHRWMRRGIIPSQQQARYEKLSKKKLKAQSAIISNESPNIYFPRFRYYSSTLGMCDVHSLTYLSDRSPRIIFYNSENRQLKMASFQVENLMQATHYSDNKGVLLYINDVVSFGKQELLIDSFYGAETMYANSFANFKIIGNTFEGKKDGN